MGKSMRGDPGSSSISDLSGFASRRCVTAAGQARNQLAALGLHAVT